MSKLSFVAALGLAALPAAASAQTYVPDIHIAYADLDLSTAAGVRTLDRRIAVATATICERMPHTNSLWISAVDRCRKTLAGHVEPQRRQVLAARGPSRVVASAE